MNRSDDIRDLLRGIPRAVASESFTAETVARARSRRRRRSFAAVAAVAAVLSVATYLTVGEREPRAGVHRASAAADTEATVPPTPTPIPPARSLGARDLIERHQRIAAELSEVRRRLAATEPAFYVGSAGDADLVLDLGSVSAIPVRARSLDSDPRPTTTPFATPAGSAKIF